MTDQIEQAVEDSEGATETIETQDQIEGEQQPEANADEGGLDEVYYEIGDIQATANDISEWKKAHEGKKSQDADYTRKSQANAESRKAIEADRAKLDESLSLLTELEDEITAMSLGDLEKLDMDELRQSDPSEYLRVKEEVEKRKNWRDSMAQKLSAVKQQAVNESFKQLSVMHGWADDQAKFEADRKSIEGYVKDVGMSQREYAKVTDPHIMTAFIEAAKYRELMKSKPTVNKRVTQAPKTVKPTQTAHKKPLSLAEKLYGKQS